VIQRNIGNIGKTIYSLIFCYNGICKYGKTCVSFVTSKITIDVIRNASKLRLGSTGMIDARQAFFILGRFPRILERAKQCGFA